MNEWRKQKRKKEKERKKESKKEGKKEKRNKERKKPNNVLIFLFNDVFRIFLLTDIVVCSLTGIDLTSTAPRNRFYTNRWANKSHRRRIIEDKY